MSGRVFSMCLAALAAVPAGAWGQTPTAGMTLTRPLTVSVGAGGLIPYSTPEMPNFDLTASVQFPTGRSVFIEAEVIRSSASGRIGAGFERRNESLNVGGNVLLRRPLARATGFFGGGLGVHRSTEDLGFVRFENTAPSWQLIGGFELPLTRHLMAFGAARWLTTTLEAGNTGLGATGGFRAAFQPVPMPAPGAHPRQPQVRVVSLRGVTREGRLVSLSSSDVVIVQQGQTLTLPLTDVRRVERATHRVRNGAIWGAVIGFVAGYLGSCGGGDENDCWPEAGAMFAGIGAGTGAGIGAVLNRTSKGSRVLYPTPAATTSVTPRIAASAASMELTIRF